MKTSDRPSDTIARADRLRRVLDEGLRNDFAALKAGTARAWAATAPGEADRREELYYEMRALAALEVRVNQMIGEGDLARQRGVTTDG